MTDCDVVIPTWQRPKWLARCLAALDAQTLVPARVLVVGRDEDVASRAVFDEWSVRSPLDGGWVRVGSLGHIPPVIAGLAAATAPLTAFLDDDAEPLRAWLQHLVAPFADSRVACVGGLYVEGSLESPVVPAGTLRDAGQLRWYGRFVGRFGALRVARPIAADGVLEGTSCWRTFYLKQLEFSPFFAEHDSLYYGLDLTFQAKAAGYTVLYEHRARAVHHLASRHGVVDRSDRRSRAFIAGRNYTYLGLRHFRGLRRVCFVLWWVLVGDRQSYGWAKALWDLVFHPEGTRRVAAEAWRGRGEGWHAWRNGLQRSSPSNAHRASPFQQTLGTGQDDDRRG
jgi:GT2 family glycosyltransferase